MTTDYDPIAEQYQRSKQQPWRTFVECFSLLELVGDVREKMVLDVACGEGFYTRMIRKRRATRVTGLDLSHGMIELARRQEAEHQLGIEYVVGDARHITGADQYDLVIAAYLLNYARTRDELQSMCDGIVRALKPDGRFVTVNGNPANFFPGAPSYRKYGFEVKADSDWREGAPITWTFYLGGDAFDIENYYLTKATHDDAFMQAGFQTVRWIQPTVSPEGLLAHGNEFWATFLKDSPVTCIECIK